MVAPTFRFFRPVGENGSTVVYLTDNWVLANFTAIERETQQLHAHYPAANYSLEQLAALDTAGAAQIVALLGCDRTQALAQGLPPERGGLLAIVVRSLAQSAVQPVKEEGNAFIEVLVRIGKAVLRFRDHLFELLGFIGLTLSVFARTLLRPSRWRLTPLAANIETSGLDAVPIVALLTFLVGAVIAFLSSSLLNQFGAGIYTVSLVVFAFLREFAVLLTAIIVAGRTASSYTAQIGSMKANEEIDALKVGGMDPVELLVLPRMLAMLVSLPALTFVAMLCGIAGGMAVCYATLDISVQMFLSLVRENIDVRHFYVGMCKAPLFAFLIAVIGCLQGFKVSGSAASVGEHTTISVVHSIFAVILLDALLAIFFMEMGW